MDFYPFITCPAGERPAKPRSLNTREGLGDRMRTAAFAEFQAIAAFRWAAEHFQNYLREKTGYEASVPAYNTRVRLE